MDSGPDVVFGLDAGDTGWVAFSLRVGSDEFTYDVSDLTDALGDLLRATLQIVCGGRTAEAVFELEPGDFFIRLERQAVAGRSVIGIRICEERGSGEVELFRAEAGSDLFAEAVLRAANSILAAGGEEAFAERWDFAFPSRALAALESALAVPVDDRRRTETAWNRLEGIAIMDCRDPT